MIGIKICLKCKKGFSPIRKNGYEFGTKQFNSIKYCSQHCARIGSSPTAGSFKKGHLVIGGFKKGHKQSNSGTTHFKKGHKVWNKGMIRERSHSWQGRKSFEPYSIDWTKTLKKSIRERDKYTCRICKEEPAVCVHHIDYNKKNCNPDNLITLCNNCHMKTNFNRSYWIKLFFDIVNV